MSGAEGGLTQANNQTTTASITAVQLDTVDRAIVGCCCPCLLASSRTDVINGWREEQVTGCMETFLAGDHGSDC